MSKLLKDATDIELMAELIRRNGHDKGPTSSSRGRFQETLIGIGKNHTAYLAFPDETAELIKKSLL